MTDETYNGYTNQETWAFCLWMHNDAGDAQWLTDQATEAITQARENPEEPFTYDGVEPYAQARYYLAETLRDTFEEMRPELDGLWNDLLVSAFSRIDWREVAEGEIQTVLENEAIQ